MRVPLDLDATPGEVLAAFADAPRRFALAGAWAGGGAIVGARPVRVAAPGEDPFALLAEATPAVRRSGGAGPARPGASPAARPGGALPVPPGFVGGGWFGWLGYELGRLAEPVPPPPPAPVGVPPCDLAFYDHVLRRTPDGRWWFEALDGAGAALAGVRRVLAGPLRAPAAPAVPPLAPAPPGAAGHVAAVADAVERIAAGELFQANLCLRLECAWEGELATLLDRAVAALRPAYASVFVRPGGGVLSLSPELFLRRTGRAVRTGPIKGTAPPGHGARLRASAKDAAEHVMIVDLMRNDLGRVCAYGSVRADPAPRVEAHVGVEHLVSTVAGTLRDGSGDDALLRAAFPPGSVTGAPKVQAMRVIAGLEATARAAYTGALGYASPAAGLELAVTIRTFEAAGGRLWLGAGGGIVADSDPRAELAEALAKAAPPAAAIGTRIAGAGPRRVAPASVARLPRALAGARERPDPARGVLETLRVAGGAPVALEDHLARLEASVGALYAAALPGDLAYRAGQAARAAGDAPLRLVATPAGRGTVRVRVEGGPPPPAATGPVALVPVVLPGGLGAHKWADRRLLDALAAEHGDVPLLVDADGTVLEAAWASVLVRDRAGWRTPPADGRILPGIARGRLLRDGTAVEGAVALGDLDGAEVRLVNAVRAVAAAVRVSPGVRSGTLRGR